MSKDKRLEDLAGDAAEKFRVSPREDARAAIEKQLIENKLLKKKGLNGNRIKLFVLLLSLAVLVPAGYFLSEKYSTKSADNTAITASNQSVQAETPVQSNTESQTASNKNDKKEATTKVELPESPKQISRSSITKNKPTVNEETNTLINNNKPIALAPAKNTTSLSNAGGHQTQKSLPAVSNIETAEADNGQIGRAHV